MTSLPADRHRHPEGDPERALHSDADLDPHPAVHILVPDTIDHPDRPSGGNVYDRRLAACLPSLGWIVHEHAMPGRWPQPDRADLDALARVVGGLGDGDLLLVDGLIASCSADVLVPEAERLRLVVLVHLPLGTALATEAREATDAVEATASEGRVLTAAAAVVTTSDWARRQLLRLYPLETARLHVAVPGVDRAPLAAGSAGGAELICVAAVTPDKGHDVLLAALAMIADLRWRCVCAGTLALAPDLVEDLRQQARASGIDERVRFVGPLPREVLAEAYAAADLLVLASRVETYGMVVTEALARGLPVIATEVGGVPEALGRLPDGSRPGILVPLGVPEPLAETLRSWLTDAELRGRLRGLAAESRRLLSDWSVTARRVSDVLRGSD